MMSEAVWEWTSELEQENSKGLGCYRIAVDVCGTQCAVRLSPKGNHGSRRGLNIATGRPQMQTDCS